MKMNLYINQKYNKLLGAFYCLILTFLYLLPMPSFALGVYSSPELNTAENMLEIDPNVSLEASKDFLQKRKFVDQNTAESNIKRDTTESSSRSPASTVHALQVMARAYNKLDLTSLALATVERAEKIAIDYKLTYLSIQNDLIRSEILWHQNPSAQQIIFILNNTEKRLEANDAKSPLAVNELKTKLYLLNAKVFASNNEYQLALQAYENAKEVLSNLPDTQLKIRYHLGLGNFYLSQKDYDNALTQLLTSYWMSVESGDSFLLAKTNYTLANLFYTRKVLDKSLEHINEAADFYKKYPESKQLIRTISLIADIYYQQGRYNLALAHYLNILDNTKNRTDVDNVNLWLNIAKSYLSINSPHQAQLYLKMAKPILDASLDSNIKAKFEILNAALAMQEKEYNPAINYALRAVNLASNQDTNEIKLTGYLILSKAYEALNRTQDSLKALKLYQSLFADRTAKFNAVNEDIFKQQKNIIEQSLHYTTLERKLSLAEQNTIKYQRVSIFGFVLTCLLLLMLIRRIYNNKNTHNELEKQTQELYTHPRTKLQNLRMLNAKLPSSLEQSSKVLEQWRLGEIIEEPLTDRLHFVMFSIPNLTKYYLSQGYHAGLELEQALGEHLKLQVQEPARIYHFSDTLFLYITPQDYPKRGPEEIFGQIKSWLQPFPELSSNLSVGMAEYPFVSKSYNALSAEDLLDILLSTVGLHPNIWQALDCPSKPKCSQNWIEIYTINNAPAASFASDSIRHACLRSLNQGLIKIRSSYPDDDLVRQLYIQQLSLASLSNSGS